MSEFKKGIEHIIKRDPCPVVPLAINGLWGSMFSRKDGPAMSKPPRRLFGTKVVITMGEAVPADEVTAELLEQRVHALWMAGKERGLGA